MTYKTRHFANLTEVAKFLNDSAIPKTDIIWLGVETGRDGYSLLYMA